MKDRFANRRFLVIGLMIFATTVLIIKLFYIQVIDKSARVSAANNVLRYITQYPARGLIYDRNGKVLVTNEATYDLMVIPAQTEMIDTSHFCNMLGITVQSYRERMAAARKFSRNNSSVFLKMVPAETYARMQEEMYKYPGFFVQARTLRKYPEPLGAHVLGYIGEVDDRIIAADKYYRSGDYIGINGLEKSYETELRGRKGVNIYMVDVHNRIKGSYSEGKYDTVAVPGKDLYSTLDIDLERYGEQLMHNKIGSIVAVEPSTGEILALVSAPDYDPELLVGRVRSENFTKLQSDSLNPLFNRALMAAYPPGSTFKMINGLIGLEEGVINPATRFSCSMGYHVGSLTVGCHSHSSPLDLAGAVMNSCNAYFCSTFRNIIDNRSFKSAPEGFDHWRQYVTAFGFGNKLGVDLPNELSGNVPTHSYYDRYYGKDKWKSLMIISLAIGQGELGTTPIQMANYTAAIANRGYYYIPHVVRSIGQPGGTPNEPFTEKKITGISQENFEAVIAGMELAVNGGGGATARGAALDSIIICGKTGTAQNPHGRPHSIFVAFAPKVNPKIAIAVYVENAGAGATYAAPVASLMIEKYLTGKVKRKDMETYIMNLKP
ncbi:MAG TPA: penicillin-binding protein 2 [Bacteroidales bacterium]|mgnify:CR=1 FL=1|nr:penicillin-binding protein 2 [Bacteroidales bacterium]HPT13052.1 penicillin-binding protein 2 [Bacteroidales bacterium]